MPSKFRAEWVLPIGDAPVRHGWVAVDAGRIAALGTDYSGDVSDLGRVAILPALVNAHTHLELSYLRGAVPPADRFIDWVTQLIAKRRQHPDPTDRAIVDAAQAAIVEARASGTWLLGDISNTLITVPLLRAAGGGAQVFYELLGFDVADPGAVVAAARKVIRETAPDHSVRVSLAPHAPYSVSPQLFEAIRADLDASAGHVSSVHLGESAEEVEFIRRGTGPWRQVLETLGVWNPAWEPPGTSPVAYLNDLGFLDRCVLAVHGVQFDGDDLSHLAALGVTVVSCPRSNRHVGVGSPPIEAFYAMDVDVAFGTDSLASAPDLNVFAELHEARRLAPRVSARRLLESATLTGARALGFEKDYGSIEMGKQARLIAVHVPEGVTDVEEYLVSGFEPERVQWVG